MEPARVGRTAERAGEGARERLLGSATELFIRKGYAGATVREIVEAAAVTKPVLYYYFRNKEGLYLVLMREAFRGFQAVLDSLRGDTGGAAERITRLCVRIYDLFQEKIEVARLMYAIYYGPPQGAPFFDFDAFHEGFLDAVRRLVDHGVRRGEFRRGEEEEMTWAVVGALNVAMEIRLCHPERAFGREGLARILEILYRGMKPQGKGKGAAR